MNYHTSFEFVFVCLCVCVCVCVCVCRERGGEKMWYRLLDGVSSEGLCVCAIFGATFFWEVVTQ